MQNKLYKLTFSYFQLIFHCNLKKLRKNSKHQMPYTPEHTYLQSSELEKRKAGKACDCQNEFSK